MNFPASHPFLSGLPNEVSARLAARAKILRFRAGALIFSKGDSGSAIYLVRRGFVKIDSRSLQGKEAVFMLAREGDCFGDIALLDGLPRTANAVAGDDCELLIIERRDFMPFLTEYPQIALNIIGVLCARLRRTTEQVEDIMFLDLRGRLARTLLHLEKTAAKNGTISMTQQHLAELVGLSREMINKELQIWASNNWIVLRRGEIEILRPDSIEALLFEA